MKIRILISLLSVLLFAHVTWSGSEPEYLNGQEFMSLVRAEKKWGKKPFSAEKFKSASQRDRASQAVDLISGKTLLGKSPKEIKDLLGPTSGYFWSDRIPTYFIQEGWKNEGDSWQLVFLLNDKDQVADVRIHKNCCK